MTYNHAPYIEDAMNCFCMQQTTFPFVAIIVDDASTDGEQEVIRRYLDTHFDFSEDGVARQWETDDAHFIYAQHLENKNCFFAVVLLKYNFWQAKKAKSPLMKDWTNNKYVAICEGDDYWTDDLKLQKQAEFMESHPDYSMCLHAVNYLKDKTIVENDKRSETDCDFGVDDIVIGGGFFCSTCSLLVRSNQILPYIFKRMADVGDFPLQIGMALQGRIRYFAETMGCYRVTTPGGWSDSLKDNTKLFSHVRNEISWLQELNYETDLKYQDAIFYRLIVFSSPFLCNDYLTSQEFDSFFDKVKFWKLKKKYRKDFLLRLIHHRYPLVLKMIAMFNVGKNNSKK